MTTQSDSTIIWIIGVITLVMLLVFESGFVWGQILCESTHEIVVQK